MTMEITHRDREIKRLRDEEYLTFGEIGEQFGLTRERVRQIYRQMGGTVSRVIVKAEARCSECDVELPDQTMTGLCRKCWTAEARKQVKWSEETIIGAFHQWTQLYGKPPSAINWNGAMLKKHKRWDDLEIYRTGDWPPTNTVQLRFGSWNNAMKAAGYEPINSNQKARTDPEAIERTWELVNIYGMKQSEVAELEGITPSGVKVRLRSYERQRLGQQIPLEVHPLEFRRKVVEEYHAGKGPAQLEREYGISPHTVYTWVHYFEYADNAS